MSHARGRRSGLAAQSYADALAKRELRFQPAIEKEYEAYHVVLSRARVRFWQPFLVLLTVGYLAARVIVLKGHVSTLEMILRAGVLIPSWTLLAALAWSRHYALWYLRIARVVVPITVCVFAYIATTRMAEGRQDVLATLTTIMLGTLFLSGLLFRYAMLSAVLMVSTFLVTALSLQMSIATIAYASASALAALVVGTFVYYDLERTNRRAFLEHSISHRLARNDVMTGLANRRAFDEQFPRDWLQAAREQRSLALLLVDVDHFKKYNDRYGHQSGDRCLAEVGAVVAAQARRPLDIAARMGGEELAVVLYDVERSLAVQTAERLRQAVQDLKIEHLASPTANVVTVSVGVAVVRPTAARSSAGLLQLADEALYDAKQRGRNRVVLRHDQEYEALQTGVFSKPSHAQDRLS